MGKVEYDLLAPPADMQDRLHKKKRLIQRPNSYFMDVKCPGCLQITTVFSHVSSLPPLQSRSSVSVPC
jgi:small subunit ribosomal protein S27e